MTFVAKKNRNRKQLTRFLQALRQSANRSNALSLSVCFYKRDLLASFFFFMFFSNANRAVENSSKRQRVSKGKCQWIRTKDFTLMKSYNSWIEDDTKQNSSLSASWIEKKKLRSPKNETPKRISSKPIAYYCHIDYKRTVKTHCVRTTLLFSLSFLLFLTNDSD